MFESIKIIKRIKKLNEKPVNEEFLALLKARLETYTDLNPAKKDLKKTVLLSVPYRLKAFPVLIIIALILVLVGGGITLAAQQSLPGDALFPVKVLAEEARIVLSFSPESKASLEAKFASERIEEIEELFETRGVEPKGLDVALERLENQATDAAAIVQEEKKQGKNVAELTKKIDGVFEEHESKIKEIFEKQEQQLEVEKEEIKTEAFKAKEEQDADQLKALKERHEELKGREERLNTQKERIQETLETKKELLRNGSREEREKERKRAEVQKKIQEIEIQKQKLLEETKEKKISVSKESLKIVDEHMANASSTLAAERFEEAKNYINQARQAIERLETKFLFDSD